MAITIVKEVRRNRANGWLEIDWKCQHCHCIMGLPQQQEFRYCFHCGAKVILKIGGKENG